MLKKYIKLAPYTLLLIGLLIFFINYKNYYIIGGDIEPFTYFPEKFLNWERFSTIWSDTLLFGGPTNDMARFVQIPVYFLGYLICNLFDGHIAQLILYCMYLLAILFSWYYFASLFTTNNWIRVCISLAVFFFPLTWILWYRQIDFYFMLLIFTPLLYKKGLDLIKESTLKSWILFILIVVGNMMSMVFPSYSLLQILGFCAWLITASIVFNYKILVKRFVILITLPLLTLIPIIWIYYLFTHSGVNVLQDSWNKDVLGLGVLEGNKVMNGLSRVFIGLTQDVYTIDGTKNNSPFAVYNFNFILNNILYLFINFIIIILWIITLARRKIDNYKGLIIVSIIFLIIIFFAKSSSAPLGGLYEWAYNTIPFFSSFRSPHQKIAVVYLIFMVTLIFVIHKLSSVKFKKIIFVCCTFVSIANSLIFITGNAIPSNVKLSNSDWISDYTQVSKFLNESSSKKIVIMPYLTKTWAELDNGYEGYHPLEYQLTRKEIYNLGYASNAPEVTEVSKALSYLQKMDINGIAILENYTIDTLVYDTNVNRLNRRNILENHEEVLNWIKKQKQFIFIFEKNGIYVFNLKNTNPRLILLNNSNVIYNSISPKEYAGEFETVYGQMAEIIFKQTYSSLWKIKIFNCTTKISINEKITHGSNAQGFNVWNFKGLNSNLCFEIKFLY